MPAGHRGVCAGARWRRMVLLVLLVGGLLLPTGAAAQAASIGPGTAAAAQPTPPPPPPVPSVPTTPAPAPAPGVPGSCPGDRCVPPPVPAPLPAGGGAGGGGADCGITNIGGCVSNALHDFFRGVISAGLNPLLELLSSSLLTTPTPASLPRVGQLWEQSWQIVLACYGLVVMVAGLVVMAHESLQTRTSIKETAPRLVVGLVAGALSLVVSSKAIEFANALSRAVLAGGLDPNTAGAALKTLVTASLTSDSGAVFLTLLGIFLLVALVVLLLGYLVRVAITLTLVVGAPLGMMCHGSTLTEPIAFWWWKAFTGCLAIQLAQSLTLITGLRVYLTPGGFTPFGATSSGLVNLLVLLALLWILIKIPFWVLGSLRIGGGRRSVVVTVARAWVIGQAIGWARGRGRR